MGQEINRRDFLRPGSGRVAIPQAPTIITAKSVKSVVISSPNGHYYKNGGPVTAIEKAFALISAGADVLDSILAGVNIVELDPEEDSVGYGGLPNADGVVQLDSSCMHGPKKQAGAVAALEGVRTPSLVAKAVMGNTDHHLLVGEGAQGFARRMGFNIEKDLNTEHSRKLWLEWKRRIDPSHYLDPAKRTEAMQRATREMIAEGLVSRRHLYGTINCDAIGPKGDLCGATTTSGLAWKIPGRVGDSPIFGAGLYVAGGVGAAGSTGRGEANLYSLCSCLIAENLRRGMHPKDAGMDALKRIRVATVEKRLRKTNGDPNINVSFYIINAAGEYAGVALYGEDDEEKGWAGQKEGRLVRFSVCTENGPRTLACEPLLSGTPAE